MAAAVETAKPEYGVLTVGQLRKALELLPDDAEIHASIEPEFDNVVMTQVFALPSHKILYMLGEASDEELGDLGEDDDEPAPSGPSSPLPAAAAVACAVEAACNFPEKDDTLSDLEAEYA